MPRPDRFSQLSSRRLGISRAGRAPWFALVLLLLALAGCSGSGSKSNSSAGDSAALPAAAAPAGLPATGSQPAAGKSALSAGAAAAKIPLQQRDLIRTATLDVTVGDVDRAAASALAAASAAGGRADADDRSGDKTGRHASLVLRVPPDKLTGLIATVAGLGHENGRTDHGQDVTTARADVDARVQELTISVSRLQDFLKHSGSITDLVALENQLTQRQSDLQSTIAQQRALRDQIGLSTLTVQLSTKPVPAGNRAGTGPSGFGDALIGALHGLLLVLRWSAAILGYLLPFAIAFGLLAIPAGLWWRQRRAGAPAAPAAPAEPVTD